MTVDQSDALTLHAREAAEQLLDELRTVVTRRGAFGAQEQQIAMVLAYAAKIIRNERAQFKPLLFEIAGYLNLLSSNTIPTNNREQASALFDKLGALLEKQK